MLGPVCPQGMGWRLFAFLVGGVGFLGHVRGFSSWFLTFPCSPPAGDRLHQDGERAEHSRKAGAASPDARAAGGPPEGESVRTCPGAVGREPGASAAPVPQAGGPPVLLTAFSRRPRSTPWSRASRACW